jgi:hypothetical protein
VGRVNIDELHQLHMDRLAQSFGVSTAMGAFRNDRAARAMGNHYSDTADPETSKEEI